MSESASVAESIWLFPGLGCRYVGMGSDLIGNFATADRMIDEAEAVVGYDVRAVCLEGSGRKHVPARQEAQVIYILECAYAAVLAERDIRPSVVSGHSLGNWAAASVCGVYEYRDGLELVTEVERLLEELADGLGQTMGVIVGLEESVVQSRLEAYPETCVANWNSPGQYVIAGPATEVDGMLAEAAGLGAKRAKRLPTNRALHTPSMRGVGARLRDHLANVAWADPRVPILSCHDGAMLQTAGEVRDFLAGFLVQPVRWDETIRSLRNGWEGEFVEVGPGNVLSGMLPFIDRTAVIQTASEILSQN